MAWRLEVPITAPAPTPISFNKDEIRREMIIGILNNFPQWRIVPLGIQEEIEVPYDLFLVKPVIKMVKTVFGKDSATPHEFTKPEKLQVCGVVFIRKTLVELPLELMADLQQWCNHIWVSNSANSLLDKINKVEKNP